MLRWPTTMRSIRRPSIGCVVPREKASGATAERRSPTARSVREPPLPPFAGPAVSEPSDIPVSSAIFLFTLGYILTDAEAVTAYIRGKIPPRYSELATALEHNVEGVLYGAIYATLVTQTVKSLVILGMNLVFNVPLAAVLALLSFVIGFFPIVGSWSVYVPVAIWLAIFREAYVSSVLVLLIGFLVLFSVSTAIIGALSGAALIGILLRALLFLGITVGLGHVLSTPIVRVAARTGPPEIMLVVGLALCFTLAFVAERIGLADMVVPHDELMARTMELATRLASGPSLIFGVMRIVNLAHGSYFCSVTTSASPSCGARAASCSRWRRRRRPSRSWA